MRNYFSLMITGVLPFSFSVLSVSMASEAPAMDAQATPVEHDASVFKTDPRYSDKYNVKDQMEIYGGKTENDNPHAPLELGRRIYDMGPLSESSYFLGHKNPVNQQFIVYGDARLAVARNSVDDPANPSDGAVSQAAARMNLDIDWKFTATERLHATVTPLEKDGKFTRKIFSAPDPVDEVSEVEGDSKLDAFYLEGDVGAIWAGISGNNTQFDLPFAIGLIPLQFHNGIWLDDAFTGITFAHPAQNSAMLNISNYDITFFAGIADVNAPFTGALGFSSQAEKNRDNINIFGVSAFLEANQGYWELGYGYTQDKTDAGTALNGFDQSYHSVAISFTRRYGDWLSNSVRVISSLGQKAPVLPDVASADGTLLLIENSFVTSSPSTLIPYLNIFYGSDRPQSLARGAGTGGILRNVGILFESDGLTGYPTLNDAAHNTYGMALGLEYLFSLNQQVVVELAGEDAVKKNTLAEPDLSGVNGAQYGLGVRYQIPIGVRWIFRADAMAAKQKQLDGDDVSLSGVRAEIRVKF